MAIRNLTILLFVASLLAPLVTTAQTKSEAEKWMKDFESERRRLLAKRERADWIKQNFITHDTELLANKAEEELMAFMSTRVNESKRFAAVKLPAVLDRKFKMVKLSATVPSPAAEKDRTELAAAMGRMGSAYGKGKYCPKGPDGECHTLGDLSKTLATSRDAAVLLDAWTGWRSISGSMRKDFATYVKRVNQGAREFGFKDAGALWRSKYDMAPDAFGQDVDRLWTQVRPLYEQLHCYTRGRLQAHYGNKVVPDTGPIPAHLLGNMWAQDWSYVAPLVIPKELSAAEGDSPLTRVLKAQKLDAKGMAKFAENFFVSLGLPPLPKTFWERSLFTKPKDREVVCHASAWPVDWYDDLRIKMCIEVGEEDFVTLHHELGHLYYYNAYKDQSVLHADSAHDGFHEALGDVIALSVTPAYLEKVGLKLEQGGENADIDLLLRRALERVAFLPFGVVIDKWRWQVFSGEVPASGYNAAWWKLKQQYQGVAAPVKRDEKSFDAGAKYHVANSVPYVRYFLAHILQFQLHRGLCRAAGVKGPLHQCSIYGSKEAGKRLQKLMEMGSSKPWPDALEAAIGERQADATAVIEYFQPLMAWLETQNKGKRCGW